MPFSKKQRALISRRTKQGLARARKRGVKLGGGMGAKANRQAALKFAEQMKHELFEFHDLSHRATAIELNKRKIKTPLGGQWHAVTVKRVRDRFRLISRPKVRPPSA
jgi:DNA invertase Pin-like site-specific DNA recombinase